MKRLLIGALGGALLALPALAQGYLVPSATADIISVAGEKIGTATFTQTPKGVRIRLNVSGIPAGSHAVHIHQTGTCDAAAKFTSAGGHFNPTGKTHGSMSMNPEHEGDMPNQTANAKGVMTATLVNENISVASLFDADGSAIVIHAMPDDYMTQPTGNAGDRIACGVIVK